MANNRLYLVDTETDRRLLLAKSFGDGWTLWQVTAEQRCQSFPVFLQEWLDEALDYDAQVVGGRNSNLEIRTEYEMD